MVCWTISLLYVVAAEGQGLSNLYGLLPFSQAQYMPAFIERDNIIIKS